MIVAQYELPAREYIDMKADGPLMHLFVSSFVPVNAYLMDEANFELYRSGKRFEHHGPGRVRVYRSFVRLPGRGPWHAVVENSGDAPVQVAMNLTS
jgi:hypothetical protein